MDNATAQGETISTLRAALGLSQAELARAAGLAQTRLSRIEQGEERVGVDEIPSLAAALDVLPSTLAADSSEFLSSRVFHRKKASLPVKADRRIRANAAVRRYQIQRALSGSLPALSFEYRPLPADGTYSPEDRAMELRRDLGLGSSPIENMTDVLEGAGVIVMAADLDTIKLDAIAGWPLDGPPIVLVSTHAPGDRQRFTLAHELGHAIMHDGTGDDQEAEADRFGSAFLIPSSAALSELQNPTLSSLVALKAKWGVSIAALARRAKDLGIMSDREYREFNIRLSATGMHRHEPVQIPAEKPKLIRAALARLQAEGFTVDELAHRAGMTTHSFIRTFVEEP